MRLLLLLLLLLLAAAAKADQDWDRDELRLLRLPQGRVAAHLTYTVRSERAGPHMHRLPRPVAQLATAYGVRRARFRLASGRWDHAAWGAPLEAAPMGADLAADADDWPGLVGFLGGLSCASLPALDATVSVNASAAFVFHGDPLLSDSGSDSGGEVRYGALPRQPLCTENLTPWLKLLPCRSHAGLAALLSPHAFSEARYRALALRLRREPGGGLTVAVGIVAVADSEAALQRLLHSETPTAQCAAETLVLGARVPAGEPLPPVSSAAAVAGLPEPLGVAAHRYVAGHGQERGQLVLRLTNTDPGGRAARVSTLDVVPWWLRLQLHSLLLRLDGVPLALGALASFRVEPARDRGAPAVLAFELELPAGAVFEAAVDYETAFLTIDEFPPDPARGFDVAPALVAVAGRGTLVTEPLLVNLPTPDFSMPYNVVTLSSTVVAFFVGTMLNALVRKSPSRVSLVGRDDSGGSAVDGVAGDGSDGVGDGSDGDAEPTSR